MLFHDSEFSSCKLSNRVPKQASTYLNKYFDFLFVRFLDFFFPPKYSLLCLLLGYFAELHSCQSSSILQKIQIYLLIYSYQTKNCIHLQEELYKAIWAPTFWLLCRPLLNLCSIFFLVSENKWATFSSNLPCNTLSYLSHVHMPSFLKSSLENFQFF